MLDRLVHLHRAREAQGRGGDAEHVVRQDVLRVGLAADVHELALVGGVDLVRRHVHDRPRALLEAPGRVDGAPLVEEEDRESRDEEGEPGQDALE